MFNERVVTYLALELELVDHLAGAGLHPLARHGPVTQLFVSPSPAERSNFLNAKIGTTVSSAFNPKSALKHAEGLLQPRRAASRSS